jgi:ribosomal protein S18 acetylase RimI-like enzyme
VLYYDALKEKLVPVFGPRGNGIAFLSGCLNREKCLVAFAKEELVGILGLQDEKGGFLQPSLSKIIKRFGLVSGLYRFGLLVLLEHKIEPGELYLDGVAVLDTQRKKGIGSRLISEFEKIGREKGYDRVTLEVIDTNPRAKALYERLGYKTVRTHAVWPFTRVFGFSSADVMTKEFA